MNMEQSVQTAAQSLATDLGLQLPQNVSEVDIIRLLEERVSTMLTGSPEAFFTLMYRLDIPEEKMREALDDPAMGVHKLARLIFQRQIQKVDSRKASKPDNLTQDEDLKW